ncbi:MAG TPA: ABC transporter permease subunit [Candidatus Aminicenantes bacterium]|nr:ABC transporter permease subunit [Candidatus Aminicenantes bacterium]HOS11734.1 ABC transporter permease subunit [Candidatus Aminicenantes bacterium]HPL13714.1 ABC transporter permease subunit [Candidatus Aminicenantes bacterium]HQH45556.1 ABC transporter permease subunit [Candidatus Aminicenantes bacterium]
MLGILVRKEIADNLLSYKFFVVILLSAVLIFTSLFVMGRDYKSRVADYQLIKPKPDQAIAVLPPNPLSVFAKGLEDSLARSYEPSVIGIEARTGRSSANTVFDFFPAPDFVYIVKVVLSLVALLFGFDRISREREAGTLKLTLANPVSRGALLFGKWLGNLFSLAVPFFLITGIGLAILHLDPSFRMTPSGYGRLALILLLSLFYMALFLSLGLFVSAVTRRSATSLVVLLLLWALMVFVLPNTGTLLARQIVEVPSSRAVMEKRNQIWTREVLKTFSDRGNRTSHFQTMNEEIKRLEEDYRNRVDRQVRLAKALNRISPAAGFVYTATEMAGTGIGEDSRLKREVVRYRDQVLQTGTLENNMAPAFSYKYRPLGEVMAEGGLFDIAWLLVFNVFFFAAGFVRFLRYDAR